MRKKHDWGSLIIFTMEILFFGLTMMYTYHALIFKSMPGLTLTQSRLVFWGLWLCLSVVMILATPPRHRSFWVAIITNGAAMGAYFMLTYFKLYKTAITVTLTIMSVLLILYILLVLAVNLPDIRSGKLRGKMAIFCNHFFHRLRMILCVGLACVYGLFFLNLATSGSLREPTLPATDPRVSQQRISDNIEELLPLEEKVWETLDAGERLNVLQRIANIEATYLGLPHELNVQAENLDPIVLGHYRDQTHVIAINVDHLTDDDSFSVVKTLCHEAYHAYERRLVDVYATVGKQDKQLLIFRTAGEYKYNFENYIDGLDDLEGYSQQAVEIDSNEYGFDAAYEYFEAIYTYLTPEVQETEGLTNPS